MSTPATFHWKTRFVASGIHFAISLVIALLAAILVFGLWYPYPYREISGGRELFFIVIVVDVVLGPLITFTIFSRGKSKRELRRDLAVVALIQLAALSYGVWTVFMARPVHLVFEYDRFRVVHAVDVQLELLGRVPPGIDLLPVTGPTLLSLREFSDGQEKMDATMLALQGISLAFRPDLWQSYATALPEIRKAAQPVAVLKARFASQAAAIDAVITRAGRKPETAVFVPMVGRKAFWTVFLDQATGEVLAYMPLDSF